jgi:rare lipoprotein A
MSLKVCKNFIGHYGVRNWSYLCLIASVFLFIGCAGTKPIVTINKSTSKPDSRYSLVNDSGALEPIDLMKVKPVIPKVEKRTAAGNKNPYVINGVTYNILPTEAGYEEIGIASWYGRKFHGHLTSNGEIYDMFQVSAAHTRLPIPSYARVTNLDNDRSIIVRINDRGPFHPGRIIDLSYAAAVILDYAREGTARVRVEGLVPDVGNSRPSLSSVVRQVEKMPESGEYLQVGAFADEEAAKVLSARVDVLIDSLKDVGKVVIHSETGSGLHKVRIGPLRGVDTINNLIQSINKAGLGTPFKVKL